jgi:hypothetical protein
VSDTIPTNVLKVPQFVTVYLTCVQNGLFRQTGTGVDALHNWKALENYERRKRKMNIKAQIIAILALLLSVSFASAREPQGLTKRFVEFIATAEGRKIIGSQGAIPVR